MSARDFKTTVLPALLVGTSRQPIDFSRLSDAAISPGDPKSDLKALALAGQALRFERPTPPSDYAAIPIRNPSRRNLPEALRQMLVGMFGDGNAAVLPLFRSGYHDSLQLAMALAFEALHLQPHPFDFHLMGSFLRAHAERLGPAACRWVDRNKGAEEKRGYFDVDELNEGNWHQATPARRQQYIEDRRRQDANAGRALVEAVWPNEAADLRICLLQALRQGLCSADAAFLEGLAKDRAPRVRELAERYRSRLPGATGQNPALRSVMERIVRREAGFIRKRVTLKLELPATVIGDGWRGWVAESFEEVEIDELARALGLGAAEMITAAAQDRCLATALAIMAFQQGNTAIARQAYEAIPGTERWLLLPLLQSMEKREPMTRQELAEYLVRKDLSAGVINHSVLAQVHRTLNGPISEGLMEEILRAPVWSQWSAAPLGYHTSALDPVAALCPAAKRPALRQAAAKIQAAEPVLQFLDMLDSLERVSPRE
jgi:Family of unknown function (DUF5691)